jgi:hypothetical protein
MPIKIKWTLKILKQALVAKKNFIKTIIKIFGCYIIWVLNKAKLYIANSGASLESRKKQPCSYFLCFQLKFNVVQESKPPLHQQMSKKSA